MSDMTNDGIIAEYDKVKISFTAPPVVGVDYIAMPANEYISLLADSMKLCALESGGVDNWNWYGESIQDFFETAINEYDQESLNSWVKAHKAVDETVEEYLEDMGFEDFAEFETYGYCD